MCAAPPEVAKAPAPPAEGLSAVDRVRLESETGDRIGIAFTNYVDACNEHLAALKAAAAESRDLLLVVADVALGLIAPGGGRALVRLLDKLPVRSPDGVYAAAMKLMDNAGTVVSSMLNGGKRAAGMDRGPGHPRGDAGALRRGAAARLRRLRRAGRDAQCVQRGDRKARRDVQARGQSGRIPRVPATRIAGFPMGARRP